MEFLATTNELDPPLIWELAVMHAGSPHPIERHATSPRILPKSQICPWPGPDYFNSPYFNPANPLAVFIFRSHLRLLSWYLYLVNDCPFVPRPQHFVPQLIFQGQQRLVAIDDIPPIVVLIGTILPG